MFLSVYVVPPTREATEHFKQMGITDPDQVTMIIGFARASPLSWARCSR